MKRLFQVLLLSFLPFIKTHSLEIFEPGQVATAESFNNNFAEIKADIKQLSDFSPYQNRMVNGVEMRVGQVNGFGYATYISAKGLELEIDEDGFPGGESSDDIYFSERNCQGTKYLDSGFSGAYEIGHTYAAVKTSGIVTHVEGRLYMAMSTDIIKLNAKSVLTSYQGCRNAVDTKYVFELLPNDPAITGFPNDFPYVVDGSDSLKLTEEVGTASFNTGVGSAAVYANGERIGVLTQAHEDEGVSIQVRLDGYGNKSITLYKDGSYSGFRSPPASVLYFSQANCLGHAYHKVLDDYSKEWWFPSALSDNQVMNNGKYYNQSQQVYKMTDGPESSRSESGVCRSENGMDAKLGYVRLIETAVPERPVFTPPITWDDQPVSADYESLQEAN